MEHKKTRLEEPVYFNSWNQFGGRSPAPNPAEVLSAPYQELHPPTLHVVKIACIREGRTGFSNRPCLSRQTGPISSGVTIGTRGGDCSNVQVQLSPAKGPWAPSPFHPLFPSFPLCDCPSHPSFPTLHAPPLYTRGKVV